MAVNRVAKERSESDLTDALRARFCLPAWAFFPSVRNAAGFDANRTADGIAMSLWPSRGLEVYGFEIKVSRGDWLSEMRNPAKSEDVFGYCDRWFLVSASRDLVKAGELPPTWGLMVPRGDGLEVVKEAPKNSAMALDRTFVAVLLKRTLEMQPDKIAVSEAIRETETRLRDAYERETKQTTEAQERQATELATLKEALGSRYHDAEKIADAVRVVLNGGTEAIARRLAYLAEEAKNLGKAAERAAEVLNDGLEKAKT